MQYRPETIWGVQRLCINSVTFKTVAYHALEGDGCEGSTGRLHPWLTKLSCEAAWLNTPVLPRVHISPSPLNASCPNHPCSAPHSQMSLPRCLFPPPQLPAPTALFSMLVLQLLLQMPHQLGHFHIAILTTLVDPNLWAVLRFQPFCFCSALMSAGLFAHFHSFCSSSHNLTNAVTVCFENQYLILDKVCLQREKWDAIDVP